MTTNTFAKFVLIGIVAVARITTVVGQFSPTLAPAPATGPAGEDCFTVVSSAQDCLTFIQDHSKLTKPDKPCCPEVKSLVANHPGCLCQLIGQAKDFGVNITRARQLPAACNVKVSPALVPCVAGPSASPTGSQPAASAAPGGTIPSGSSSSPTGGGGNGASGGAVVSVFALATALGAAVLPIFF